MLLILLVSYLVFLFYLSLSCSLVLTPIVHQYALLIYINIYAHTHTHARARAYRTNCLLPTQTFREMLAERAGELHDVPAEALTPDDWTIARFIKARKMIVKAAVTM